MCPACCDAIQNEFMKDRYKSIRSFFYVSWIRITTVRIVEWMAVFQAIIGLFCWDARTKVRDYDVHFRFPQELNAYKLRAQLLMIQLLQYIFAANVVLHRLSYRGIGYDGSLLTRLSFHVFMIIYSQTAAIDLLDQSKKIRDYFDIDINGPHIENNIYYDDVITDSKVPYAACKTIALMLTIYAQIMIFSVILDLVKWVIRLIYRTFRYIQKKRQKKANANKSA